MKVLLDECIDWRLSRDIVGHEVKTARQMGWAAFKNGELLALASDHFQVFVTVDRNLSFQPNLGSLPIAVIALQARTNRLAELKPLAPSHLAAIDSAEPGIVKLIAGRNTLGPVRLGASSAVTRSATHPAARVLWQTAHKRKMVRICAQQQSRKNRKPSLGSKQ